MKKYSMAWFIEQSREAQRRWAELPEWVRRNDYIATATLPSVEEKTKNQKPV